MTQSAKVSKTFEQRMSKKVAELTQVVHMLFTRNHEREIEIQCFKQLYDNELDRLELKNSSQIEKLKSMHRQEMEKMKTETIEKERGENNLKLAQALAVEQEARNRLSNQKDHDVLLVKAECQKVQGRLDEAHNRLRELEHGAQCHQESQNSNLKVKDREINRLNYKITELEQKLHAESELMSGAVKTMNQDREKLHREINELE